MMFTTRRSIPGSSPATLVPHLVDGKAVPPKVTLIQYDRSTLEEREITDIRELPNLIDSQKVTWINVDGLGDLEILNALGEIFHLHPLTLEDVLNTGHRPKIEVFPEHLFIVAQMVYRDREHAICGEQVSLFLGNDFLLTIQQEQDYDVFDPVRERIRSGRGLLRTNRSDYLAYALLDSIVDHYYPVLEELGNDIDELEDELLEHPSREMVQTLHGYKRNLTGLRRFVWPLRDVVNSMLHDTSGFIAEPTKMFIRDCYDHTVQLMELVESYKEVTSGLMELYHSSVGLRTNEVMRVLTVITSIFIPLTFIVGVYGMNFAPQSRTGEALPLNMPELYQPHGYLVVMAAMLFIALLQLIVFRRLKWL